jgi:hypothetical protein
MKRINFKALGLYVNVQKIAALFFILLIVTAYSITFKDNSPVDFQKQKLMNAVKNHQEKGISTLAITSLPFWLAIRDKLTNEDN